VKRFLFADRPATLTPPEAALATMPTGSTIELHAQAEAFVATLAERLEVGAAFFVD
jgi:SAM-dependent MidA family methyltransferase